MEWHVTWHVAAARQAGGIAAIHQVEHAAWARLRPAVLAHDNVTRSLPAITINIYCACCIEVYYALVELCHCLLDKDRSFRNEEYL